MEPNTSQLGASAPDSWTVPAEGYTIPDITFCDPKNRRLKVLTIGAGVSGIMMAYHIQKECQKYAILELWDGTSTNWANTALSMSYMRRTMILVGLGSRTDTQEQHAMCLPMLIRLILH
jgi:hypothetical protein